MVLLVIEIITVTVGIVAGVSGAAWDIYQLCDARAKKRVQAAIVIQRAFRKRKLRHTTSTSSTTLQREPER